MRPKREKKERNGASVSISVWAQKKKKDGRLPLIRTFTTVGGQAHSQASTVLSANRGTSKLNLTGRTNKLSKEREKSSPDKKDGIAGPHPGKGRG